ncbi:MAG: DNA primase, partial [Chloroflexota bacterium]|nr:DNA primase [Chloroflexota bacterium]
MGAIDDVKERLDIVDLVSSYTHLQKSGRNFKALCPFHNEKTPSFFVFPERGTWHCFGSCGTGGDIFSFVMKKEGVDFGAALKLLADRAGVKLESIKRDRVKDEALERLHQLNEAAAKHYHEILLSNRSAEPVRHYLNKRGIDKETVNEFGLGFSLESRDALYKHLSAEGYTGEEMVRAGLAVARDEGGYRDLFRNRLMIPIRNESGKASGFGARILDGSQPKYINSPQTPVFDKSGLLYGLDLAREAIRERDMAIIVEGYLDVISLHQRGWKNAVAPMGTSLTSKQFGLLKRFTKNVALALDADAAGEQATLRGLEVARQALSNPVDSRERGWLDGDTKLEGSIKVILMSPGEDPDEVVREHPEDWERLVDGAMPVMEYLFEAAVAKFDPTDDGGRASIIDRLLPRIMQIADTAEKEIYFRKLSRLVDVAEKTLMSRSAQLQPTRKEKGSRAVSLPESSISRYPLEEYCLALLLQNPDLRDRGLALSPEHFEGTENREIFVAWMDDPDVE